MRERGDLWGAITRQGHPTGMSGDHPAMPIRVFNCANVDGLVVEVPSRGGTASKRDGPVCRQPWLPLQRHTDETAVQLIGKVLIPVDSIQPRSNLRRVMGVLRLAKFMEVQGTGNMRLPVLFFPRIKCGRDISRRLKDAVLGLCHPVEVSCNDSKNLRGRRCPTCQAQPHVLTLAEEGNGPFLVKRRILRMQGRRRASGEVLPRDQVPRWTV